MTQEWSLERLLDGLHRTIQHRLGQAREVFAHPVTKGDACEKIWIELLSRYLPERYRAARAFVVDSEGQFSEQIDIVVFDRQYSPFIFESEDNIFVPAESVYAVLEAKQEINAHHVGYAQKKIASVRRLHRTSLPIPHAGGVYPPKPPISIIGGIVTFESGWSPPLGKPFRTALMADSDLGQIDIGCIAEHGYFFRDAGNTEYHVVDAGKPATAFLFKLIEKLQVSGTVPMIDIQAYGKWLVGKQTTLEE